MHQRLFPILLPFMRFVVVMTAALAMAWPVNRVNFNNFYDRAVLRVHTDMNIMKHLLPGKLSTLLLEHKTAELQKILDTTYGAFTLVVTDCTTMEPKCPQQRILYKSAGDPLERQIRRADLLTNPFDRLTDPPPPTDEEAKSAPPTRYRLIGRVYYLSNLPESFSDDFFQWLRHPFIDRGAWKYYLITVTTFFTVGLLTWVILELALRIRRIEKRNARLREEELTRDVERYVALLDEKEQTLLDQETESARDHDLYVGRIRELERKLLEEDRDLEAARSIIRSLDDERRTRAEKLREELERTNREKQLLLEELGRYRSASPRERLAASRALESALEPLPAGFEGAVAETIRKSGRFRSGHWTIVTSFDTGVTRNVSQFVDFIVISRECAIVVEAKGYFGVIEPEGDAENSRWVARTSEVRTPVKSSWGENPYRQVREYCMGLMHILATRSTWKVPVYGVVVFPDEAEISSLPDRLGRFYRVTKLQRLNAVLEQLEAEARRENSFTRRPSPADVERVLRGVAVRQ